MADAADWRLSRRRQQRLLARTTGAVTERVEAVAAVRSRMTSCGVMTTKPSFSAVLDLVQEVLGRALADRGLLPGRDGQVSGGSHSSAVAMSS